MKSIFDARDVAELTARIDRLTPATAPLWGRMTVGQMLAHCNVSYEMLYDSKWPKPGLFKRLLLNLFVKPGVVGPKPYRRNLPTAPQFRIVDPKDFAVEKQRLVGFLHRVQQEGEHAFDGRESLSFGRLSAAEWNTMFYKHLDHHLSQFGV